MVALRQPILDAVRHHQLLTDGGETVQPSNHSLDHKENPEEQPENEESDCDCADLASDFPCWECYRTGRRDLPE